MKFIQLFKYLIIGLILLLFVNNAIADVWVEDDAVVDGIQDYDIGSHSSPHVFKMNDNLYLISGRESDGNIFGWIWNGSAWVADTDIINGLGGWDKHIIFTYLEMDGNSYLIAGSSGGVVNGYKWNIDIWELNNMIQDGISDTIYNGAPTYYRKDSESYLIIGSFNTAAIGYIWNDINDTWDYDYDIPYGLGDIGFFETPRVFEMDSQWYLISGENTGNFYGFKHNGTQWVSDSFIVSGLYDLDMRTTPTIYEMDNLWYLISGNNQGEFFGFGEPTFIILNFKDNCGNLLRNTEFQYCNHLETITCYFENTSSGSYNILFENQDYLEIWTYSAIARLYYNITNPQDISYTILNDKIAWTNGVYVRDGNTSVALEDVLVTLSQDCIIDSSLYPSRNKYTDSSGIVFFDQCELNSFYLSASLTGYKPINNEYVSMIHSNAQDITQTTMLELYPIDDPVNESILTENETIATTYIYFKDNSSYYTNSILDTDEYVDLYYFNNNSESASMTLKFQKYNIYTGLSDILSWNIPYDTSGYKRIYNANFTDHTYSYYGYLYNVEIDGWNTRARLSVRNETKEVIDYYQNLSTNLWFENKNPQGDIDYREDISIIAYANSDNSSLLEISLELYNNSVYVDHINLTWADFIGADVQYYYEWKPDSVYTDGHNYTVQMRGYDYYLLETDYINASDFRKNKLTIIVKDRWGSNLDNAYVFLEGYGSLSTGISYYNSYEGLNNGEYRYKASKSGYSASGWDNINLTGSDEIVCYVLTSDTGNTTYVPNKFDDTEIKLIFFPLMFFLLIMILIGGFKYVSK